MCKYFDSVKDYGARTMYRHKVQYYETDKMGITHHSNYVRWMEEARVDFLDKIGWNYDRMEKSGIISPVVKVECSYKKTTTFSDLISVEVFVEEFKGVKLKLSYEMTNEAGDVVCQARSEHCFLNEKGVPLNLKREHPDFYETMIGLAAR